MKAAGPYKVIGFGGIDVTDSGPNSGGGYFIFVLALSAAGYM
jgi:hypothetical protein